jgi:hypothetical protein
MNVVRILTLALTVLLVATVASAHGQEKLGKVNFPTSCAAAVQPQFERSVERPEIVRAKAYVAAN